MNPVILDISLLYNINNIWLEIGTTAKTAIDGITNSISLFCETIVDTINEIQVLQGDLENLNNSLSPSGEKIDSADIQYASPVYNNQYISNSSLASTNNMSTQEHVSLEKKETSFAENANEWLGHINSFFEIYKRIGKLSPFLKEVSEVTGPAGAILDLGLLTKKVFDNIVPGDTQREKDIYFDKDQGAFQYEQQKNYTNAILSYAIKSKKEAEKYADGKMDELVKPIVPLNNQAVIKKEKVNPYLEAVHNYEAANAKYDQSLSEYDMNKKYFSLYENNSSGSIMKTLWDNVMNAKESKDASVYQLEKSRAYNSAFEKGRHEFDSFVQDQKSLYSLIMPFAKGEVDNIAKPFREYGVSEANRIISGKTRLVRYKTPPLPRASTIINFTKPMIGNFTINVKDMKEGMKDFKLKVEEALLEIIKSVNAQN